MKRAIKSFIAAFVILGISGCGYTTGALLPPRLKSIYIDNFKNSIDISNEPSDKDGYRIYRSGLENDVTQGIIDRFIFNGYLKVVDEAEADLVLRGEVVDYYKQPLRYDKFDNVEEYRVIVTVNMELFDAAKEVVMWKEHNFIGHDSYLLTGSNTSDEETAREDAIENLAEQIVERVLEEW